MKPFFSTAPAIRFLCDSGDFFFFLSKGVSIRVHISMFLHANRERQVKMGEEGRGRRDVVRKSSIWPWNDVISSTVYHAGAGKIKEGFGSTTSRAVLDSTRGIILSGYGTFRISCCFVSCLEIGGDLC